MTLTIYKNCIGRVIVAYAGPKPNDSDLKILTDAVNKLIALNKPVEVVEMDRKEAEIHYTKNPVNGQYIYEKREPPASVESLTIVTIPECTVSVSASKEFVESTKLVGGVDIVKFNHRENKQELEVVFNLLAEAPVPAEAKAKATPVSTQSVKPSIKADSVPEVSSALFDAFIDSLQKVRPDVALSTADIEKLRQISSLKNSVLLNSLKNASYSSGFAAHLPK